MNDNELNRLSELILDKLNSIENQNKTKKEQIELIKPVLIECSSDSRRIGRTQILNYFKDEIDNLRNKGF
jgi:sugar-specific transcriptional regulator TrmB